MIALRAPRGRGPGRARLGRRVAAAGLAVAALVSLSACAAGRHAGTAEETPVIDGSDVNVGTLSLRNVSVIAPSHNNYAKGSDAALQLVIVNNSTQTDTLTKVTTDEASSVEFYPDAASAPASVQPTGSSAGSGTSSGSSAAPGGNSGSGIDIRGSQSVQIGFASDNPFIVLRGLTDQLFPAQSFPITFTFAKAGSVTFYITVHLAPPPASPATAPIEVGEPEA